MNASPRAGKLAEVSMLVDAPRLTAYYTEEPDPSVPEPRVASALGIRSILHSNCRPTCAELDSLGLSLSPSSGKPSS